MTDPRSPRYSQGRALFGSPAPDLTARELQMAQTIRELVAEKERLQDHLADVQKTNCVFGAAIEVRDDRILVHNGEQMGSYERPSYLREVVPGDVLKFSKEGFLLGVEKDPPAIGRIFKVSRKILDRLVCDDGRVVIDKKQTAEVGHEVLLDMSGTCVVKDLGKPPSKLAFTEETGITWDDIGGQEKAKAEIREAIEGPVVHAEIYREFGLSVPKGILLHGPPGCGKTMFAKAMATSVAELTGHKAAQSGFIYVKGPEVINKYVGESEAGVRAIFEAARAHFAEHHYPAVVCIDEADALVGARKDSNLTLEKTIVPQFLAEMDGLDQSRALVLLLTNRPDTLDPAIVRDGRIDLKIKIGRPNQEEAAALVRKALCKKLVATESLMRGKAREAAMGSVRAELGQRVAEMVWESKHALAMIRVKSGGDRRVQLSDVISGAMLVGIVERGAKRAVRRHLEGSEPKGIVLEDLAEAIREIPSHIKGLNLSMELSDVVAEVGGPQNVVRIEPL